MADGADLTVKAHDLLPSVEAFLGHDVAALAAPIGTTETSLPVDRILDRPTVPFTVRVDDEYMTVTALTDNGWSVTRATSGSVRAVHAKDAPVSVPAALTGSTVLFIMRLVEPPASAAKVRSAATLANAALGQVRYDWATADTNTPGRYYAEFQVTYANGKPQTFPTGSYHVIDVLADLDNA